MKKGVLTVRDNEHNVRDSDAMTSRQKLPSWGTRRETRGKNVWENPGWGEVGLKSDYFDL